MCIYSQRNAWNTNNNNSGLTNGRKTIENDVVPTPDMVPVAFTIAVAHQANISATKEKKEGS